MSNFTSPVKWVLRNRVLAAIVTATLAVASTGASTAWAAQSSVPLNAAYVGATVDGQYNGIGACALVPGYDSWQFEVTGGATSVDAFSVTFNSVAPVTYSSGSSNVSIVGSTITVFTPVGANYSLGSATATITTPDAIAPAAVVEPTVVGTVSQASSSNDDDDEDSKSDDDEEDGNDGDNGNDGNDGDNGNDDGDKGANYDLVLTTTCVNPEIPTSTSTTLYYGGNALTSATLNAELSLWDEAVVRAASGTVDPVGSIQFYYCFNASSAPVTCDASIGTAVGSPVAVVADATADGISYANSGQVVATQAGHYLFHAVFTGTPGQFGNSYDDGTNERIQLINPDPGCLTNCFVAPAIATTTVTQVWYGNSPSNAAVLTPNLQLVDKATVTAASGSIDPVGTVSFYYCFNAQTAPGSCSDTVNSGSLGSVAVGGGDGNANGIVTATSLPVPSVQVGFYHFFAKFVPANAADFTGSIDQGGAAEAMAISAVQQPNNDPAPTFVWPQAPVELRGSDPKPAEVEIEEVAEEDTQVVGCGVPVTFKLTGPADATYSVVVQPKNGTLYVNAAQGTATWVPNPGYCEIGGNDGFVMRWVDSKGNRGTITKMIMLKRQGDIPNMMRTGQSEVPSRPRPEIAILVLIAFLGSAYAMRRQLLSDVS